MKILKIVAITLIVLLGAFAVLAPVGPVPGFFIGGIDTQIPDRWDDTSSIQEIKLKVNGGILPRVVIIWVIQNDGDLYIVGSRESGWVSMLADGGPVYLRIEDRTYATNAEAVSVNQQPILEAYKNKYRPAYPDIVNGMPSFEESKGTVAVFKLAKT